MLASLNAIHPLNADVFQYDFTLPEAVPFKAGQFVMLKVKDALPPVNRSYSIASSPTEDGFKLCIKLIPGGRGSEFLRAAKQGDEMEFTGPFGHFFLQESTKDIVMVATGTGLAPFMGMLPVLFAQGFAGKITLLFGVRHEEEFFYLKELSEWQSTHANFQLVTTLSQPTETWQGAKGRVTEHFAALQVDPTNTEVYICGNGQMVKDLRALALEKGFEKTAVHLEQFTPA